MTIWRAFSVNCYIDIENLSNRASVRDPRVVTLIDALSQPSTEQTQSLIEVMNLDGRRAIAGIRSDRLTKIGWGSAHGRSNALLGQSWARLASWDRGAVAKRRTLA